MVICSLYCGWNQEQGNELDTKRSWLKCAWHEPNRKFCREKGEIRTWILLIKVLTSWPFGPFWKLQCGMHHCWCLNVLCLPSVQVSGRREVDHSLRASEGIFGKQLFGEWDRDWWERSLWQEWRLRRGKPAVSGNVQTGKERFVSGMRRDLWN